MPRVDPEPHIARIKAAFGAHMQEKYLRGQAEHGGSLETKESLVWLLDMLEEEVIDAYVYLRTLRERILGRDL
jgi:hypothetical protein